MASAVGFGEAYDPENNRPSMMEVTQYCKEQELSISMGIDFWCYYDHNSWMDPDGQPVRNWKALLHSWDQYREEKDVCSAYSGWYGT